MKREDIVHDRDQPLPAGLTGKIQTVTGLIDPGTLGVCLTHEHLLIDLSELLPPAQYGDRPCLLRETRVG